MKIKASEINVTDTYSVIKDSVVGTKFASWLRHPVNLLAPTLSTKLTTYCIVL